MDETPGKSFGSAFESQQQKQQAKKQKKAEKPLSPELQKVVSDINNLSSRLRILEEKASNLRKKTQVNEQNMLESHKKINLEIKTTNSDLLEIKRDLSSMKDEIKIMVNELKTTAKKRDLAVIERYLDFIEPLNLVSKGELQRLLAEK